MKKIACLDVGLKRIGLAFCLNSIITPQNAILRKNRDQAALEIKKILDEWSIEILVVGLPKGGSSEDEMKRRIEHFVSLIDFKGLVHFIDEYGSSDEAKALTKGHIKQKKDGKIDSMAACVILERFLREQK